MSPPRLFVGLALSTAALGKRDTRGKHRLLLRNAGNNGNAARHHSLRCMAAGYDPLDIKADDHRTTQQTRVFCFFFAKKKAFPPSCLPTPAPAA